MRCEETERLRTAEDPFRDVRGLPRDDIRTELSDIRKEIEETNRTLKRIAEGLERGRR
jgi:hypothetical protein